MSLSNAWPHVLEFFGTPLVIEPSTGQLSGDAGLLPVRQFDERIGLTRAFAAALDDPRNPNLTEHSILEMVLARVYGILAGNLATRALNNLGWPDSIAFSTPCSHLRRHARGPRGKWAALCPRDSNQRGTADLIAEVTASQ